MLLILSSSVSSTGSVAGSLRMERSAKVPYYHGKLLFILQTVSNNLITETMQNYGLEVRHAMPTHFSASQYT